MYYNKILRIWVIDPVDYFLISVFIGSLVASFLKDYLSEKKAMERLKKSIINKSGLVASKTPILESKKSKIKRIYKFALENRGGQFEEFKADHEFSNEVMKMAQQIQQMVERLAAFLKRRELKGVLKLFFRNGRLILELILFRCNINMSSVVLSEGLSIQVIVFTVTVGGAAGFTLSWFSAGAALVFPPLLLSTLLLRSLTQQRLNQRDYLKFKKMVNKMLDDNDLKETLRAFFMEGEGPTTTGIEMKPWDSDKTPLPEFNFDSDQTFEGFIKARMKEKLGLVENPTPEQLEEIIKMKPKGKTVYLKDLIDKIAEDPDDIIDAEIVKEAIRVKLKNEEL